MKTSKAIFVSGTGTDVGKTYVTALLLRQLVQAGMNAGYYKAALSGADNLADSDAGYVKRVAGLTQSDDSLLSYRYRTPVSPHLASQLEQDALDMAVVVRDFGAVTVCHDYTVVEGSGGIVCPLRWDDQRIMLTDVVGTLGLSTLIVADAGLGSINATVLTVNHLRALGLPIAGILLNRYDDSTLHRDNRLMIQQITGVAVLATVADGATTLDWSADDIVSVFEEVTA